MIAPTDGVAQGKGRNKTVVGNFWDDADYGMARAYNAVSIEDLKPLMTKPLNKLMSSHVQKIMQVCFLPLSYICMTVFPLISFTFLPFRCWVNLYTYRRTHVGSVVLMELTIPAYILAFC